ncbi:Protein RETICULATA-RELATED 6 [Carex littledalei]|uniref:Protein RETICULATA-RELATED 6 n=1 Tax=Carex littledalei TaxID=544730 RepID=A0A833R2S4_9POAL|nr:Protein RETICULATA-RELATED 6 [Carex littledalei]
MASKAILSLQLSRSPPCSRTNPNPSSSLPPSRCLLAPLFVKSRRRLKLRPLTASATASSQAAPVDRSHLDALERCLSISQDSGMPTCSAERSLSAPPPMGKKGRGTALSITLEKSKTEYTQAKKKRKPPEVATGGGGGDIGKKIGLGGGDGGDDDDDDDYFGDFDDEDEGAEGGLFRRRIDKVLKEIFNKKIVDAVLQEWGKTFMNLPAGLRQAYELGLVSSAQLVKFLTLNARPTTSRFISRALPESISRAFVGRILADPAFLHKLLLESAATIATSTLWEFKNRKERIKEEWDLALTNILTATACNAFVVWSLAPCRSYGSTFRFDLENTIQKLPNNIFEKNYLMREFDLQKRIQSFLYKTAQLGVVGTMFGFVQGAVSNLLSSKKEERLSMTLPSTTTYALSYGAFLGLYANIRYQAVFGLDRVMFDYFDVLGVYLFFSTALRTMNTCVGETSKLALLGVQADPLVQSDSIMRSYNKQTDGVDGSDSRWFICKNAIISGLGLLGFRGNEEVEAPPPKPRRKRVIRKKISTSSA